MSEPSFEYRGINHLALVCQDMARTVAFYRDVLGMPLIKTVELPAGMGQHFFFDCGGGDALAFFWFADAPPHAPGIAAPANLLYFVGQRNSSRLTRFPPSRSPMRM